MKHYSNTKIALILTGHFRCWKQILPNFKQKIIDRYHPDVYINTWSDEGWWSAQVFNDSPFGGVSKDCPKINRDEIMAAYNPIKMIIEEVSFYNSTFIERAKQYKNFAHNPLNIIFMYYKLNSGIKMIDKDYDLIIRMRPDLVFHEHLPDFDSSIFYTLAHRNHLGQGTGDMIQIGNMENMKKFSSIHDNLTSLYNQTQFFCPHIMAEQHIKNNNLEWKEFYTPKTLMHTPKGEYVDMKK